MAQPARFLVALKARPSSANVRLYVSGAVIGFFVLVAIAGPELYPFEAEAVRLEARLLPPGSQTASGSFLLGTDSLGRDLLGQLIYGARVSLLVGAGTVFGAGLGGFLVGLAAGYYGGWLDRITMRLADIQLSLPPIVLAILLTGVIGPSIGTLIFALALTRWVVFARVTRSSAIVARERPFVESARLAGLSHWQIARSHIAPFTVSPLLVVGTLEIGLVILAEAALSFLGLGTSRQQPSWGLVIANGRDVLVDAWWVSIMPGIALMAVVVSVAVFGDELRDRLQPDVSVAS
jgi:peptide/nickel transport system permease protein